MSEPIIMRVAPPADRSRRRERDADAPSLASLLAAPIYAVDGLVIGGTVCPGLLICVPAILLVVAPLVLIGLLLLLAGLVIAVGAAPVVLAARLWTRHRARAGCAAATHRRRPVPRVSRPLAGHAFTVVARRRRNA